MALHQEIVDQRHTIETETARAAWSPSFRITYRLQDGSYVLRSFPLPVYGFDYETADRSSLAWAASELQNDPKVLEAKYFPPTASRPMTGGVWNTTRKTAATWNR